MCIRDRYSTAQNAYYAIDDSRQLGQAGTDLGGATGKFNFMFTDAISYAQPGDSLKYKVYVTNQNSDHTIHYNQQLTMVDGSNMPLTTQNYIMEIKRS